MTDPLDVLNPKVKVSFVPKAGIQSAVQTCQFSVPARHIKAYKY